MISEKCECEVILLRFKIKGEITEHYFYQTLFVYVTYGCLKFQIFVLTDGEVSNSINVVDLVKRNSTQGRVFALGLGASASRHLVKGIAR